MNATETQRVHSISAWLPVETSGCSLAATIGAAATVILGVIGLAGLGPELLASIATIIISAAILAEGWLASSSFRQASSASAISERGMGTSGALTAEFLGGFAGTVLGILALFDRTATLTLLSSALLVYGATLVLSAAASAQAATRLQAAASSGAPGMMPAVHSGHMLVGLGAVVLGILAVIGLASATLVLVGLVCLGAAMLFDQFQFP